MQIRPLQEDDLEYACENSLEGTVKYYPQMKPQESSYTGLINDRIIGVGGVINFWEGVGELWLILTKDVLDCRVEAYKCIKEMARLLIDENKLLRAQAHVRTDLFQANKMVEHLGFICEGKLRKYYPDGCDSYVYGKVK
jgi:hypothetical protein